MGRSGLDFGDQILIINGVDVGGMGPSAVQAMLNYGTKVCSTAPPPLARARRGLMELV